MSCGLTGGIFWGQEGARAPGRAKNPRRRPFFAAEDLFLDVSPSGVLTPSKMHYGAGVPPHRPLGVMGACCGVGWGGVPGGRGGFGAPQRAKNAQTGDLFPGVKTPIFGLFGAEVAAGGPHTA